VVGGTDVFALFSPLAMYAFFLSRAPGQRPRAGARSFPVSATA